MSHTDNNTQGQKPKTSKLAIVSVLIPLATFVGTFCFIEVLRIKNIRIFEPFFFLFPFFGFYLSPVTFVLAIFALIKIKKSKGLLKGYVFSTLGILMSVLAPFYALRGIASIRPEAKIRLCEFEMMEIGKALKVYSNDYDIRYPTADKWCDLLIEHTDTEQLVCRPAAQERWRDSFQYAINPNARPNSLQEVVLLFETKGGWNKFGGPEIVSFGNHYRKGCNILFNDGHVEFVTPEQFGQLKWKAEEKVK